MRCNCLVTGQADQPTLYLSAWSFICRCTRCSAWLTALGWCAPRWATRFCRRWMWLLADGLHDYLLAPAITGDDTPTRLLRAEALRHICRPALQDDHCRLGWPLSLHSETTQKESPWDEPGAFKELNIRRGADRASEVSCCLFISSSLYLPRRVMRDVHCSIAAWAS